MLIRAKKNILKWAEEEFIKTTDTLWENEVSANMFVARVMFYTAIIDLIFIILALLKVIIVTNSAIYGTLIPAFFELAIPAGICFKLKGRKKWLKIVMMLEYAIVLARIESVLTHNVTLCMAFPVVLSIRYYSRPLTNLIAATTTFLAGFADYAAIMLKMGRIDLNMLELPAGTVLNFKEFSLIRDVIMQQATIDYDVLWKHTLQHSFLPKIILFSMIAIIASEISKRGRLAIFNQQAETRKTERISTELNLASDIQTDMLPNIFPAFPERFDFDIYATMTPAKEVGGDFYDFFLLDNNRLALVMADVSGKGVPAAMFMVIAKTLIKDHAQLGLEPADVFTRVNNLLCEGNKAGLFVTAWMGVLELDTGKLTYVNAGHNPPVVKLDNQVQYLHSAPGFVLAGLEGYNYKQFELDLHKGDKIFLYTDGATEATNLEKELYGEDRLIECLRKQDGKSCAEALKAVREDIDAFVGEAEQFDDLTLLAFDYSNKDKNKMTVERVFNASPDELPNVISFVEEELEKREASMKNTMAITVAVEEMFVNIAHYAYEGEQGKAVVRLDFDENDVTITFTDTGIPFNPLAKEDPDINAKLEDRQIGGLGIYMVKQSMDHCAYERSGNRNIFSMRKALQ